jgi:surface protein
VGLLIRSLTDDFRRFGLSVNQNFVFTVETTTDGETFTVPAVSGASYNCNADWGDSSDDDITTYNDPAWTHTYVTAGIYEITISGIFTSMIFDNLGDIVKIKDISNWGNNVWASDQSGAYRGCRNLTSTATDYPDWSSVTDTGSMFNACTSFDGDLSQVDTSNITSTANMFVNADSFNSDLSSWDMSNVTNAVAMFYLCNIFNGDVSTWDVSSLNNTSSMFRGCPNFNQDLSNWITTSLINASLMFENSSSFNQDISGWDVSSLTNASAMLTGSAFDQTNYDLLLVGWEAQAVQNGVTFSAGSAKYGAGAPATARAALIADHSWTITDGGAA